MYKYMFSLLLFFLKKKFHKIIFFLFFFLFFFFFPKAIMYIVYCTADPLELAYANAFRPYIIFQETNPMDANMSLMHEDYVVILIRPEANWPAKLKERADIKIRENVFRDESQICLDFAFPNELSIRLFHILKKINRNGPTHEKIHAMATHEVIQQRFKKRGGDMLGVIQEAASSDNWEQFRKDVEKHKTMLLEQEKEILESPNVFILSDAGEDIPILSSLVKPHFHLNVLLDRYPNLSFVGVVELFSKGNLMVCFHLASRYPEKQPAFERLNRMLGSEYNLKKGSKYASCEIPLDKYNTLVQGQ